MKSCLFASLLIWVAAATSTAHADTAVLLPMEENAAAPELRKAAHDAVKESLEASNYRVVNPDDAAARLQTAKLCSSIECGSSVLSAVGAGMLVALGMDLGDDKSPRQVIVTLVDVDGRYVNGSAAVEADVATAARAAFQRAFTNWPGRGGVPLRVDGNPVGATVLLDGQLVGMVPLDRLVPPGRHRLVVHKLGYAEWAGEVIVPPTPDKQVLVEVSLQLTDSTTAGRGPRWHLIGGSVLLAAGAVTMTTALISLSARGCNERAPDGTCVESTEGDAVPLALWTGAGGAAVLAGTLWMIIGQRRSSKPPDVHVDLAPSRFIVRGRF